MTTTTLMKISSIALYQARNGHLAVWRLDQLMHDLGDQQVDLPALRQRWGLMLETGDVPFRPHRPPPDMICRRG